MKKIIYLTESDLYRITKKVIKEREDQELEQELDEIVRFNLPVGTKLGNIYQGIKGFMKGESYGYFNYLSKIKNRTKRVMNELEHIETFVKYLNDLKPKIEKLNIAPEKKLRLLNLLDTAVSKWEPFFTPFSDNLKEINKLSHEKLSGERLDVVPGLNPNEIGSDLMNPKVKPVDLSNNSTNTGGNTNSTNTGSNTNSTNTGGNTNSTNTGGNTNSTNTGGLNARESGRNVDPSKQNNFNVNNDSNIEDIDYVEVDDEDEENTPKDNTTISDKDKPIQEEIKRFRQIIRF